MTQRNSLSEWLEQTRRINKHVDLICMEAIDAVIRVLPFIERDVIKKNKKFFDSFCDYYHKPNPIDILKRIRKRKLAFCLSCETGKPIIYNCTEFVQSSLDRCAMALDMVKTQWFEIVDFMWERPELVNPHLVDEYVRGKVDEVCRNHRKKNPLKNGVWKRFGAYWKDSKGKWHKERRNRF